jgi:nitroreductase
MDIMQAITERRSIRKYLDVPVEWDKVGDILEAGRLAPSSGNLQDWRFIVVTKQDVRKKIAECCPGQNWVDTAPVIIVIFSLTEKVKKFYGMRGERLYAIQNCAACATHMILAATSLGLGSCWIGAFDENMLQRAVGLPDNGRPQMLLTIGYADEKPQMPNRYQLDNLTFFETYGGGGAGRIKDIGRVLWDQNVVGRAIQSTKETVSDVERHTKKDRESIVEKAKEKLNSLKKKLNKK